MAELVLDVHLEIDPLALASERDGTKAIAEMSLRVAEDEAVNRRATLRHSEPRDLTVRRAIKPVTGAEVLLVATRWLADGPQA